MRMEPIKIKQEGAHIGLGDISRHAKDVGYVFRPEKDHDKQDVQQIPVDVQENVTPESPSDTFDNSELLQEVRAHTEKALDDIGGTHTYMAVLAKTDPEIAKYFEDYNAEKVYADLNKEAESILDGFSGILSDDNSAIDTHEALLQQFVDKVVETKERLITDIDNILATIESGAKEAEIETLLETYNPNEFPATFELFSAVLKDDEKRALLREYVNKQSGTYLELLHALVDAAPTNDKLRKDLAKHNFKNEITLAEKHQKINIDLLENAPSADTQPESLLARYTALEKFMLKVVANIQHLVRWKKEYIKPVPIPKPEVISEKSPEPVATISTDEEQEIQSDASVQEIEIDDAPEKRRKRIAELMGEIADIERQLKDLDN